MGATIVDVEEAYINLGAAAFRARYTHPVLVRQQTEADDDEIGFRTGFMSPDELANTSTGEFAESNGFGAPGAVHIIVKPAGKPFQDRIGVGRAPNADVSIRLPRISKYHGFFTRSEHGGEWFFTDAESKNGTWVDMARLVPGEPHAVKSGCTLAFGPYVFILYQPAALVELIAQRVRLRS